MAKTVTSLSAIENTAPSTDLKPWKAFVDMKDETKLQEVHWIKEQIAEQIGKLGREAGIENLSLQHLMTMPDTFNRKVTIVWNPKKNEWFRYVEGKDVPSWLAGLGKSYRDYVYDPTGKTPSGRNVTPEMIAQYRGRGSSGGKATSLDDL
jgi:hypothetical protein